MAATPLSSIITCLSNHLPPDGAQPDLVILELGSMGNRLGSMADVERVTRHLLRVGGRAPALLFLT
eukprot:1744880-Prymnesium_polylepis.1